VTAKDQEMTMRAITIAIAFAFALVPLLVAATPATARQNDHASSGVCKSGKRVNNLKTCRENGGKN
ncbi:MAG TPA: hypothetical protein VFS63_05270, partial [Pseudolabrys sp.]|nr:hypothetical protein [Pseudolabrys sp.]